MKEQNHEKEFEQSLKKKSDGFELKPSGEVWQNIESSLRRDHRKVVFWWSFAALMAIAIGTGGYFIMQHENSNLPIVQESKQSGENQISSPENSSISEPGSASQHHSSEQKAPIVTDHTTQASSHKKDISGEKVESSKMMVKENSMSAKEELRTADNIEKISAGSDLISVADKQEQLSIKSVANNSVAISSLASIEPSHRFSIEADAVPLATYSWNKESSGLQMQSKTIAANNSFWNTKGFSVGASFLFYPSKTWFIGSGIHFTKTITQINFATEEIPQYDTTYIPVYSAIDTIINISYIDYQPKETDEQNWLDVSFFTGAELFPYSKNHLRLAVGAAYSHLISMHSDNDFDPSASLDASGGNVFLTVQPPYPLSFNKNQFQLFSEVAYVHDFGSRFRASAGGQFHYYPFNLVESNSIMQHMLTLGLKVGVQYNF